MGHLYGPVIFTRVLLLNRTTQLPIREPQTRGNCLEALQVSEGNLPPGFSMNYTGSLGNGTSFKTNLD